MFIADTHCDTLYSMLFEAWSEGFMASKEKLIEGKVNLQTFALFAGARQFKDTPYENARRMIEASKTLDIPFITGKLPDNPPEMLYGVYSIEGGEVLQGKIERLKELDDELRIRMIALTWNYDNQIGTPAKIDSVTGLKDFGFELLKEMDARGIYADVSHLNERGFWDVYENMNLPPIASHSNCKALCGSYRNLNDDQIKAITGKNGYIGINFYPHFLKDGGEGTSVEDVIRHIDYIAEKGGIHVIGLGSDFDGIEVQPEGMETAACMYKIADNLKQHGYSDKDIEGIMGMNLWNLLKKGDAIRF